jgi:hypothetical protein
MFAGGDLSDVTGFSARRVAGYTLQGALNVKLSPPLPLYPHVTVANHCN